MEEECYYCGLKGYHDCSVEFTGSLEKYKICYNCNHYGTRSSDVACHLLYHLQTAEKITQHIYRLGRKEQKNG